MCSAVALISEGVRLIGTHKYDAAISVFATALRVVRLELHAREPQARIPFNDGQQDRAHDLPNTRRLCDFLPLNVNRKQSTEKPWEDNDSSTSSNSFLPFQDPIILITALSALTPSSSTSSSSSSATRSSWHSHSRSS